MNNTKVLLIDAHEISREGLKLLLHSDSYDVVGAIRSLEEARTAIARDYAPIWFFSCLSILARAP
jgi:DNA-binding NarL/FixJ family response regulator